jgi:hypothetical protein
VEQSTKLSKGGHGTARPLWWGTRQSFLIDKKRKNNYSFPDMNSIIENRQKIKKLEIAINLVIEDNFGQCPNYPYFQDWMERHQKLWDVISKTDKEWFESILLNWDCKVENRLETWETLPVEQNLPRHEKKQSAKNT